MQPHSVILVPQEASPAAAVLHELARLIGPRQFQHWFHKRTTLAIADDELSIGVGSPFLLKWLQKQFRTVVVQAAQAVLGPSARVRFEVAPNAAIDKDTALAKEPARVEPEAVSEDAPLTLHATTSLARRLPASKAHETTDSPLRTQRTVASSAARPAENSEIGKPRAGRRFADLGDFVSGSCNELALTAAWQVCEAPAQRINPLFIYGPVGTGKTHLLEGVYRQIRRTFPALQVVFLTSEAFTNYFTQALREHTLPSFRQRFRTVDVLIVDDVDFLDGKKVVQEEFLHTFKQLESHGRQIVVSCDRHPRLLAKSTDELKTRFLSGMVCRLEPPDAETRLQIVTRKAARLDAEFSPEALEYVAHRFTNNIRELEGALHCLRTWHCMTGKRIGVSAARQVLADLERDCVKVVRLADIERVVCGLFGLDAEELKSSRRTRSLSQPRMLAMFLARKHTRAAYSEIGQFFGGRNHSTVISAERKITDWLAAEAPIKVASQTWRLGDILDALEQQLQAG